MSRLTSTLASLALGALATSLLPAAVAAGAAEAPPPTTIRLERLERGADAAAAYVDGDRVVDGARSTRVRGRQLRLLGTRPDGRYVVVVHRGGRAQVRAVTPEKGSRKILPVYEQETAMLSGDGTRVVTALYRYRAGRTLLRAYDSTSGVRTGSVERRGYESVLDADATTVVHSGDRGPVVAWDPATGTSRRVSARAGYAADLAADRLAVLTGDPYEGGCSVVSTLSDPGTALWRSCEEGVVEFSPDGSHVATTHLLTDGLGPSEVAVHTVDGEETGRYRLRSGYFPRAFFEDADTLLLDTSTEEASAVVRCDGPRCELASNLGAGGTW